LGDVFFEMDKFEDVEMTHMVVDRVGRSMILYSE
jgi:hypothetical protein